MSQSLLYCQKRITTVWFGLALLSFLLLIGQTMIGNVFVSPRQGDLQGRAFTWFLPTVAPTLSLVLGVMANAELRPEVRREAQRKRVSLFFYRFTLTLSVVYLLLVLATLLLTGTRDSAETKLALLDVSHYFLTPVQSLVSVALGVFFLSPDAAANTAQDPARAPAAAIMGADPPARKSKQLP